MLEAIYQNYVDILRFEMITAMGCTEPIAIAYAGAVARKILGREPDRCVVRCSGNIIKNVKGVSVPHSGGRRGIDVAATLGIVGGDPSQKLEVLSSVTDKDIERVDQLLSKQFCRCVLAEDSSKLFIDLQVFAEDSSAEVEISGTHTNITRIMKDGILLAENECDDMRTEEPDKASLNVRDILTFANEVKLEDVRELVDRQIECNQAISQEGLHHSWGACVGRTLLTAASDMDVKARACAAAAAGSDARMGGCPMPVVINSGSGNQGITVSLPILIYAREAQLPYEKVCRALCAANLIAVHQKKFIGNLSAYCGAVSAACAAACGVAYLFDDGYDVIAKTIINTICTVGGIVCDGAKSSCAAKIAASVNAALTAWEMSRQGYCFQPGEGLTGRDVEETIAMVGCMGREGMHETDIKILQLMLAN